MKDDLYLSKLEKLLNTSDLILPPVALIVNPSDKPIINEGMPEIEKQYTIIACDAIEKGSAYLINRDEFERNPF